MRTEEEMVAYALEIDQQLLPYVPELLSDLEELGSDAELLTGVVADLGLGEETTVVDLGCGKGALAVEIAGELGFKVLGIELFAPFIEICNAFAHEHQVSNLCDFRFGNVLDMADVVGQFDIATFTALGDVLGGPDETVKVLREYVKPGGFLIISDVCLVEGGSNQFPGFEQYLTRGETVRQMTSSGDVLVKEVTPAEEEDDQEDDAEAEKILARAKALCVLHPELEDALMTFAANQAEENKFVDENFTDVIWVLQKV